MGFGLHSRARGSGDVAVVGAIEGDEGAWDGDVAPTKQGGRGWAMCLRWRSRCPSMWQLCLDYAA
jgi:hypothetical protein